MSDETETLPIMFSRRQAEYTKRRLEEEERKRREKEEFVSMITGAISKQNTQPLPENLSDELARLRQELSEAKIQLSFYTQNRPTFEAMKDNHVRIETETEYCTGEFKKARLRSRKGAKTPVADVNTALESFAEKFFPKVRYGYHDHSKYLKKVGLPDADSRSGARCYVDWELLPDPDDEPLPVLSSISMNGLISPERIFSTSPSSAVGSPTSSPRNNALSSQIPFISLGNS